MQNALIDLLNYLLSAQKGYLVPTIQLKYTKTYVEKKQNIFFLIFCNNIMLKVKPCFSSSEFIFSLFEILCDQPVGVREGVWVKPLTEKISLKNSHPACDH
jgi:hypothetical protein